MTRRLPTTGLAALAVLLAALAIVVGVDGVRTRIHVERRTVVLAPPRIDTSNRDTPPHATLPNPVRPDRSTRIAGRFAAPVRTTVPADTAFAAVMPATTGSTTTTTTTTTIPAKAGGTPEPVVGATASIARVQSGYFEGGFTSVTTPVPSARSVSVSLGAQVDVSLTVSCASGTARGTGLGTVTVDLALGGGACQATISVPVGSPDPLSWVITFS
jgi:hypothetical protein